ncbi:MAG TPA: hypothetical protein VNT55_02410 [Baekduia sp.]|nr:hypothetical protein [Baekduia sp.]
MSLSPSSSHGAPTLAEVLLQRTFARPPQPFADGELLQALTHPAKDAAPSPDAVAKSKPSGSSSSDSGSGSASGDDASASSSDAGAPGRTIDVRV